MGNGPIIHIVSKKVPFTQIRKGRLWERWGNKRFWVIKKDSKMNQFSGTSKETEKEQHSFAGFTDLKLVPMVIWDSVFIWTATTATHGFFRRPCEHCTENNLKKIIPGYKSCKIRKDQKAPHTHKHDTLTQKIKPNDVNVQN